MRLLVLIACLCLSLLASRARADYTVSLVTFGPGPLIYERFGHNGIRFRDDARGIDHFFDWGHFDFTPDFTLKFVKGDLNYWMDGISGAQSLIDFYADEQGRTTIEQTLNLSPEQAQRLHDALMVNLRPENRVYRYDYYKDNCSTRARDALDRAVDGQIRQALSPVTDHSLRWHTRRLMPVGAINKLCETLADLACGPRIDAPLSQWESGFIPMELAARLDAVQIRSADGSLVPLVRERRVLHTSTSPGNAELSQPWNPIGWTLPFSLVAAGGLLLLARSGGTRTFRLFASAWELFVLFAALFMPGIILFTWHWVVAWNANLLQFTPLSLLILAALWIGRFRKSLRWAAPAAVALSAAGLLVTISHLSPQRNAPAVALALPLHLAVMIGHAWTSSARSNRSAANDGASPVSAPERNPAL